jgi:vancomycin resistance protein VanJ
MRGWVAAGITLAVVGYVVGLFGWALLHALFGDRWWWLFVLNSFAPYYFVPLVVLVPLALWRRQRAWGVALGGAALLGAYLYGGLFLPRPAPVAAAGSGLTVMTYNMLGFNEDVDAVVAAVRASDADVVGVQELNPPVAEALQRELGSAYPYQVLDPRPGVTGMGVLSRHPLRPRDEGVPGEWVGTPQVLGLDFAGRDVMLLHFHATSGILSSPEREWQAQMLASIAAAAPGPVVALGDLNATDLSTAYRSMTGPLRDAWRDAGWGLGHTFPGADPAASPGSSRLQMAGVSVPMWLVRIDYVFASSHWHATAAWRGPWDGRSDHRPVAAHLVLAD